MIEALIGGPDDKHGGLGANGALSLMPGEGQDHVATVGAAVPPFARRGWSTTSSPTRSSATTTQ